MLPLAVDVLSLARQHLPELAGRRLSSAFVMCSNPVTLVFSNDCAHPVCVLKIGSRKQLAQQWDTLQALREQLGTRVPQPIAVVETKDGLAVMIETGLEGAPWFQLRNKFSTPRSWDILRQNAVGALKAFERAVCSRATWRQSIHPGDALRSALDMAISASIEIHPQAVNGVQTLARSLDQLGTLQSSCQHGDFCLNNLLITKDDANIIDFEDFGATSLPLHDCFGLALSLHEQSREICRNRSLRVELRDCLQSSSISAELSQEHIGGLFVHYLLWMAGRFVSENRRSRRDELMKVLHQLMLLPSEVIPDRNYHESGAQGQHV